ncbi:hypothetical protein [Burkholderia cepacia]|uniref:hypothetical protein n=1 Tax=Burkholderia cepacia TaxID=292 RepID=UPI0026DFBD5C|nr:hypothetical protein [Burkholderia cepacia]MDO5947574.1 hypothetical protein [Burkholderia cepacia]
MTTAESVNLLRPSVTMQVAEFARETFGRQMRGAVEKEPVEFGSSIVQSFVRRDYLLLNKNLHFAIDAPRTLPRYDTTTCDEIDELFRKKIGESITYVNNLKQQLWQLFLANAVDPKAEFPSVLRQDLLYVSPHAKNYIKLLRIADEYMLMLWAAYLNGLVSARDRHGEELKVRKRIRSITNLARDVKFQTYKKFNAWQANEQTRTASTPPAAAPAQAAVAQDEPAAPTKDVGVTSSTPADEAHVQAA